MFLLSKGVRQCSKITVKVFPRGISIADKTCKTSLIYSPILLSVSIRKLYKYDTNLNALQHDASSPKRASLKFIICTFEALYVRGGLQARSVGVLVTIIEHDCKWNNVVLNDGLKQNS